MDKLNMLLKKILFQSYFFFIFKDLFICKSFWKRQKEEVIFHPVVHS